MTVTFTNRQLKGLGICIVETSHSDEACRAHPVCLDKTYAILLLEWDYRLSKLSESDRKDNILASCNHAGLNEHDRTSLEAYALEDLFSLPGIRLDRERVWQMLEESSDEQGNPLPMPSVWSII